MNYFRITRVVLYFSFLVLLMPAFSEVTAIKAGHLVNPESGIVQKNAVILVEDTKIKAVGAGIEIPAPLVCQNTIQPGESAWLFPRLAGW